MKATPLIFVFVMLLLAYCHVELNAQQPERKATKVDPRESAKDVLQLPIQGRFVDLTHPFNEQTIYWPTENGFRLEKGAAGVTERGYFYSANRFAAAEHGGTHIDAPIHFFADRDTVDRIPLERLINRGVVVDVSSACAANRDYQVQVADLRAWEERQGRTVAESIVLIRTGWGNRWPNRQDYLGTARLGQEAVAELHFPGLHPDAARWLVEQRAVRSVGIDTASIDYGQSTHFETHVLLCRHNVPAFENVANMEQLPDHSFTLIALPMKIQGGSGGPLRIIAVLP
jgi:kynurenine formamidase